MIIKALCPGLVPHTQIHLASPVVDELFRLCDPAKRSPMNATTISHICNCTRYSCICDNNCMYYTQMIEHRRTEPACSEITPRPHSALSECIHHGVGWRRSHAHTTKLLCMVPIMQCAGPRWRNPLKGRIRQQSCGGSISPNELEHIPLCAQRTQDG